MGRRDGPDLIAMTPKPKAKKVTGPVLVPETPKGPIIVPESLDPEAAELQLLAGQDVDDEAEDDEEIPEGFVRFCGQLFEVPERVNRRLLLKFGTMQMRTNDLSDVEKAIVVDRLLDQLVRDEDRDRFDAACDQQRVEDEDLRRFIADALGVLSDRPTQRPSASQAGPRSSRRNSEDDLSSRVIRREEEAGRPDRAQMVRLAQEFHNRAKPTTAWGRMTG